MLIPERDDGQVHQLVQHRLNVMIGEMPEIGVDRLAQMRVVVAIGVEGDIERQPHTDVAGGGGVASQPSPH